MIDIHSHLLPGVDDGSPSVAHSVPVLERFAADGVECLVCTPHLNASQVKSAPHDAHRAILETLRAEAPAGMRIELGWEIMLDEPGVDFRDPRLALAGSKAILVEFPRNSVPAQASEELYRIRCTGIVPVLAHPERYYGCTPEKVNEWKRSGAVIQMDTAGLVGTSRVSQVSRDLLEAGLVDLFSSDNHGDSRSLAVARDWLLEVATPEHAELLTRGNAARVLANEPLLPVPPLPSRSGLFARLRELFLKR